MIQFLFNGRSQRPPPTPEEAIIQGLQEDMRVSEGNEKELSCKDEQEQVTSPQVAFKAYLDTLDTIRTHATRSALGVTDENEQKVAYNNEPNQVNFHVQTLKAFHEATLAVYAMPVDSPVSKEKKDETSCKRLSKKPSVIEFHDFPEKIKIKIFKILNKKGALEIRLVSTNWKMYSDFAVSSLWFKQYKRHSKMKSSQEFVLLMNRVHEKNADKSYLRCFRQLTKLYRKQSIPYMTTVIPLEFRFKEVKKMSWCKDICQAQPSTPFSSLSCNE